MHLLALLVGMTACHSNDLVVVEGGIVGRVVDMEGRSIQGAEVSTLQADGWTSPVLTDDLGAFATPEAEGNRWVRVRCPGWFQRTRAATPASELLVRLSPDDGDTLALQFTGDAMLGRRFYDPNDDGNNDDGLLQDGVEWLDVPQLLMGTAPLFDDAALTSINFESPLAWGGEPHPTKDYWYYSVPPAAWALWSMGIDYFGLGNNHVYDYLEPGLESTLDQFQTMGIPHSGSGATETDAWIPEVVEVGGIRVAFVDCTSITGDQHEINYVADDEAAKGGAARCESDRLETAVQAARSEADIVVTQVHGGFEYDPHPSESVSTYSLQAVSAGSDLVVNHHPHVIGGVSMPEGHLTAWSMGNFLFDQTLWVTLPSAILNVQMGRDGTLRRAWLEPLLIEDYQPKGVVDWFRLRTAREIAGLSDTPMAIDDGAVELDLAGLGMIEERVVSVEGSPGTWSYPTDLRDGEIIAVDGEGPWRIGRDILLVGDFEDWDVDGQIAEGSLWEANSEWEAIGADGAHDGLYGLRLQRDILNGDSIYSSPKYRITLPAGTPLTTAGWLRTEGTVHVQLSWYPDTKGESSSKTILDIQGDGSWQTFQMEGIAPADAVAVGLYLILDVPDEGEVTADFDGLRMISWTDGLPDETLRFDAIQTQGPIDITMSRRFLPGL